MSRMLERRSFITGLVSLVAAPAIVRAGSLMPVKVMVETRPVYEVEVAYGIMRTRWITKAEAIEMFPYREAVA